MYPLKAARLPEQSVIAAGGTAAVAAAMAVTRRIYLHGGLSAGRNDCCSSGYGIGAIDNVFSAHSEYNQ